MIYLYCGEDAKSKRASYEKFLSSSVLNSEVLFINRNNFDRTQIESLYSGASLFSPLSSIFLEGVLEYEETRDFVLEKLDKIGESANHFLFLESKLGKPILDAFKKVGDSLAGRFYVDHLFPFTLGEMREIEFKNKIAQLLERSGFPEPLLTKNPEDADRWRSLYTDSLLGQDVLEFQDIEKVNAIRQVYQLLKNRIGQFLCHILFPLFQNNRTLLDLEGVPELYNPLP